MIIAHRLPRLLVVLVIVFGMTLPILRCPQAFAADTISAVDYQQAVAARVREIADQVLPSVVSIEAIGALQADGEVRQDAPTSGLVLDQDGHVLASSWVTRGPSASIIVTLGDGKRFPASVIAEDKHRELVLLKIEPKEVVLQPVELEPAQESSAPAIGATMLAIARYGESVAPMVSTGVLSAVDRLDGTAVQSDVRISPVFYGGPLLDLNGKLVGVLIPAVGENGAEDPTEWYDSGIAFAVPADVIAKKLERLREGETIRAGLLGLVVGGSDPYAPGTTLATVRKRSPADKAGLQTGDQLLRVGGRAVRHQQEVKLALGRFDAGEDVTIEYQRDGEIKTTTANLAETIEPLRPQYLGIESREGRITAVLPGSPADGMLQVGDEVKSLDKMPVQDDATLRQRMWSADPKTPLPIEFMRQVDDKAQQQSKEILPVALSGPLDRWQLESHFSRQTQSLTLEDETWESSEIRLPDVSNQALLWHPPVDANLPGDDGNDATSEVAPTALAVCLLPPSQRDLAAQLKPWRKLCQENRVAMLLIASDNEQRWQLAEIDAVSKLTVASIKQAGAATHAVSVISLGVLAAGNTRDSNAADKAPSGPADSMALAISLSTDNIFHGVAIPASTNPPGIRLRRDAPMRLLRVLMTTGSDTELPPWSETLERLGCPLQTAKEVERIALIRWCRSLFIY
jgi:S1-C subfamily serine protease